MDSISIFCIVLGILTIVGRGPLIFAPSATLRAYDRLFISTNTRLRAFAVVLAALAMPFLLLSFGEARWLYSSTPSDGLWRSWPLASWCFQTVFEKSPGSTSGSTSSRWARMGRH